MVYFKHEIKQRSHHWGAPPTKTAGAMGMPWLDAALLVGVLAGCRQWKI